MRLPFSHLIGSCLALAAIPSTHAQFNIGKGAVQDLYNLFCASCHGQDLRGGAQGSSLLDEQWTHGATDEDLFRNISEGLPGTLMIPWKHALAPAQIRSLVIYLREQQVLSAAVPPPEERPDVTLEFFSSPAGSFRLEGVARGESGGDHPDATLWGFVFLPDGALLATQRDGTLWHFAPDGGRWAIAKTPQVWRPGAESGLFDVILHPDYAHNGWIYLSYSEASTAFGGEDPDRGMTVVARGRIVDRIWTDHEIIFRAAPEVYSSARNHFGCRLAFDQGYLYFSIGDFVQQEASQDPTSPLGKIHRVNDDGSIPGDNPFAQDPAACRSVWSLGNRNAQGLVFHPQTGELWSSEHGPRGGDEINIIRRGANYGWPLVTHGINYDGSPITKHTTLVGMEDPVYQWTPSIATAGIAFVSGDAFPAWRGGLLVGGMWKEELHLLTLDGATVRRDDVLLKDRGRVRHVVAGPDGYPYISLTNGNPREGHIYRLVPADGSRSPDSPHG